MLKVIFRILVGLFAAIQALTGAGAYAPARSVEAEAQPYPYVFVHGYAGWGFDDGLNDLTTYWGGFNGDFVKFLNEDTRCECYNASVGSFSSGWDRACELYAQLTGTRVDYGKAHSETYNHARYGKTYETPLFEGWSESKKINLIAHSFGGNTVRLLATLMAEGSDAEREATPAGELSPLFAGGNGGWIYSITTFASPHNGTTLTDVLGADGNSLLIDAVYGLIGVLGGCKDVTDIFDPDLAQWNLNGSFGLLNIKNMRVLLQTPDTGLYDLTLQGARELNKQIKCEPDIYYYSYAGDCTVQSKTGNYRVPANSAGGITARLMGRFTGKAIGGEIEVDETWLPNDGTVNTVSALHPETEPFRDYSPEAVTPGVWQVMPVMDYNHNAFSGGRGTGKAEAAELANFIINQINIINAPMA